MLLKNLIKGIPKEKSKIVVSGISTNSKEIKKNYIFFAIKGSKVDGNKYIYEAISKGSRIVVTSSIKENFKNNILFLKYENPRQLLSIVSSKIYKNKPRNLIAVTGTNGKTSVADLFYQILRINRKPVASIGTFGIKYNGKIIKTNLTSPDTIALHKNLYLLKKKNINNVIIESSSHGLDQKRLHHINFKGGIFTNFSQDHLDYHKSMNSYLNSKLVLFKEILTKNTSIISDREIQQFSILF